MNLIGNGVCDAINVNKLCQFDGLDCCYNSTSVDDGNCDLENLNQNCNFDGKDCRSCVMWRQIFEHNGQRDPYHDKPCSTEIQIGSPGYCECGMGNITLTYPTCEEACEYECYFENCPDTNDSKEKCYVKDVLAKQLDQMFSSNSSLCYSPQLKNIMPFVGNVTEDLDQCTTFEDYRNVLDLFAPTREKLKCAVPCTEKFLGT